MSMSVCLFVCLSVCLSVYLSVREHTSGTICTHFVRVSYTKGDNDVILFLIYASWFSPLCCR